MNEPTLAIELAGMKLKNPLLTASGTYGYGREYLPFFKPRFVGRGSYQRRLFATLAWKLLAPDRRDPCGDVKCDWVAEPRRGKLYL